MRFEKNYYSVHMQEILHGFENEVNHWRQFLVRCCNNQELELILDEARQKFTNLLACMPFIGGEENHLTGSFIGSVRNLALYKVMKHYGKSAEHTGRVLFEAEFARIKLPATPIPDGERINADELMEMRRVRALRSQEQRYPDDYVYKFIPGKDEFDYGYDFFECAAQKIFHTQDADEFTPFYCYLDYPKCKNAGLGLKRTKTLAEGWEKCNHRFIFGGETAVIWPPPFSSGKRAN